MTSLIFQFDLQESVRQGQLVPAPEATQSSMQRQEDLGRVQQIIATNQFKKLQKLPIHSAHMFFHSSFIKKVEILQIALVKASTDIVDRWFSDKAAKFTQRMPLEAREEDLLKWIATSNLVPQYSGRQGMWRPDLLLEQSDCGTVEPVICEINARFPYNAWLLVASLAKSLQDGLKLDKVKVRTTSDYSAIEESILGLYDLTKPLHVLMGESWKGLDVHDVIQLYKEKTNQNARIIYPHQLQLTPDSNSATGYHLSSLTAVGKNEKRRQVTERVWQVSLEINQPELGPLDPLILREVARICVNDFRSIFLVNDQRFMAIIREELESLTARSIIDAAEAQMLNDAIAPTYLPSGNTWPAAVTAASKDSLILKATRGGEGKGHIFGHSRSQEEWDSLLQESANTAQLETTYAVQTRVKQIAFDLRNYEEGPIDNRHVVGSFNVLNGKYHGLSGMRSARDFVLSLQPGGGGLVMAAFTNTTEE